LRPMTAVITPLPQYVKQNSPDMPITIIRPGLVTIATGFISNTIAPSSIETMQPISITEVSTTEDGNMTVPMLTMAAPNIVVAMMDIMEGDGNQRPIYTKG